MSPIEFLAKLRDSLVSFDHNEPTCKRLIKKVFFEGMPVMVRQLLSASGETDVDLVAQKATDILSVSPTNPPTDDKPQYKVNEYFDKQLGNMSDAVDELKRKLEKFTSDQRNKGSAPTSTISKNKLCFYHNRYGNRAHKCISPCSLPGLQTQNIFNRVQVRVRVHKKIASPSSSSSSLNFNFLSSSSSSSSQNRAEKIQSE